MARNRQRSKQRQAERRAARLEQEREGGATAEPDDERVRPPDEADGAAAPTVEPPAPEPSPVPGVIPATGVEPSQPALESAYADPLQRPREGQMGELTADEEVLEEERVKADLAEAPDEIDPETLPRTPGGDELGGEVTKRRRESGHDRPRLVNFLIAVWAELRRVQWPDRQTLITLTWVVVVFVVVVGSYLGLLDAIFSRLINAIL